MGFDRKSMQSILTQLSRINARLQQANNFIWGVQISKIIPSSIDRMGWKKIKRTVKGYFEEFLFKEINPPPLLFFSLYAYGHLKLESPDYIAYTFFFAGLLFALLFRYNHFYFYSPVLNSGIGYFSVLNLALGVLAANEKWKAYLYFFIIGDALTMEYPLISKAYTIGTCLYFCADVYRNLTFKALSDNVTFFTGFFSIFVFELFSELVKSLDGYSGISYFSVPFAALIAHRIITGRIQGLNKEKASQLRNSELIWHYIKSIEQEIKSPEKREGYIQTHRDNCSDSLCYCRNINLTEGAVPPEFKYASTIEYYYLRALFCYFLARQSIPKLEFVENKFIEFLIDNGQISEAIERFMRLDSISVRFFYFRWVERARISQKIKLSLEQSDYFNTFSKEFTYVFKYDMSYLYLASEIKEILKRKMAFWTEVGGQGPLMVRLQQLGSEIVERMYELNKFYHEEIKRQEEKIYNFSGTIMYAMYLLSTTNYKEYAESLIKNTSRTLESIKIHEDNIAETYGIRVVLRDPQTSCNEKLYSRSGEADGPQLAKLLDAEPQEDAGEKAPGQEDLQRQSRVRRQDSTCASAPPGSSHTHCAIIENISGPLCKVLKSAKNEVVGRSLSIIIPGCYREKHDQKMERLLSYHREESARILTFSFLNRIRDVPMKTQDGHLINTRVSVKISGCLEGGLSFVALVQTLNENKVTVISDFDGRVLDREDGPLSLDILNEREVRAALAELKKEWESEGRISPRKLSLFFKDNNYSVNISSPYQSSFNGSAGGEAMRSDSRDISAISEEESESRGLLSGLKESDSQAPLHVDITNESLPYMMNPKMEREEEMTKCIKKMESVFYKKELDSQASSNSSRKSSVVNVLMSFSENYFIPFYGYIMGLFAGILVLSLVGSGLAYGQMALDWDDQVRLKNPIVNMLDIMSMRSLIIKTINHQFDLEVYRSSGVSLINQTEVEGFYGIAAPSDYEEYVQAITKGIQKEYTERVSSVSMSVAEILKSKLEQDWEETVPTFNPGQADPEKSTQSLPIQNILMNYLVDLDLLSLGAPYPETIISLNFWAQVEEVLEDVSGLQALISEEVAQTVELNIVYAVLVGIGIGATTLPLQWLLKKRVKKHVDIYDLIVSVEGEQIGEELTKLENIVSIVNNSNESSEVLKTNTINYLARKRSSVHSPEVAGSNEMIEGLISQSPNGPDPMNESECSSELERAQFRQQSSLQQAIPAQPRSSLQSSDRLELRKRSGELDLEGSEGEFKTVVLKHWLLYGMVVLTVVPIVLSCATKVAYYEEVDELQYFLHQNYQNTIDESQLLLNTKLFLRGLNSSALTSPYHGEPFTEWLEKAVYSNFALMFQSGEEDEQTLAPCAESGSGLYAFCRDKEYSLTTLRIEINQFVKQAYQRRLLLNEQYHVDVHNHSRVPASEIKEMSEHFFYVQSLQDRVSNVTHAHIERRLEMLFQRASDLGRNLQFFFWSSVAGVTLCALCGLLLIDFMKKLYFREIIIVSFLNNEMISKNKRVESFLETLSKTSY